MFCLHPALIWAIALCCLCALLYLCTFATYLKGVGGSISQMINLVPMADLSPKVRSTAVSVFVIDVEDERDQDYHVYNKSATLNLEALAKEQEEVKVSSRSDLAEKSDSLTNLLECDVKDKMFSI